MMILDSGLLFWATLYIFTTQYQKEAEVHMQVCGSMPRYQTETRKSL